MEFFAVSSNCPVVSCDLPQVTQKPKFTTPAIYKMGKHVEDEIQFEDEDLISGDQNTELMQSEQKARSEIASEDPDLSH